MSRFNIARSLSIFYKLVCIITIFFWVLLEKNIPVSDALKLCDDIIYYHNHWLMVCTFGFPIFQIFFCCNYKLGPNWFLGYFMIDSILTGLQFVFISVACYNHFNILVTCSEYGGQKGTPTSGFIGHSILSLLAFLINLPIFRWILFPPKIEKDFEV